MCEIDGSSDDDTVGPGKFRCHFVDDVIEYAPSVLAAGTASDASPDSRYANFYTFGFDAVFMKGFLHFVESAGCASVNVRATIQ